MHLLNQSILLNTLGWTLFNSLWQMSLLWLIYILVIAAGKKFSANTKHSIALFLLGSGSVWFVLSLITNFFNNNFLQETAISIQIISNNKLSFIISCKQFINSLLPYCSCIYLIALSFLIVRYIKYYTSSQQLRQNNLHKAPVELRIFTEKIASRIGIHKNVKLWLSSTVKSPMTIGFFKPVILIPLATINHLSPQQMEAVLLHELAHIKRNDYFVNLLISITEIIFFFNPFAMLLVHAIKKERENSCDDLVIQFQYDSCAYASALLSLEKARSSNHHQLAMAAVGRNNKMLLNRVLRITGHKNSSKDNKPTLAVFILIAVAAAFAALIKPEQIFSSMLAHAHVNLQKKPSEIRQVSFISNRDIASKKQKSPAKRKNKSASQKITDENNSAIVNEDFVSNNEELNGLDMNEATTVAENSIAPPKDYSMAQSDAAPSVNMYPQNYPYVPSTSFSYNDVEDVEAPKRSLAQINKEAIEANVALRRALKQMNALNLKQIAKKTFITRKEINENIVKLQNEVNKCAVQLKCDLENKNAEQKLSEADEIRLQKDLEVQVQTFQSLTNSNSLKAKQLSQDIMKQQIKLQKVDLRKQQELKRKLLQLSKKLKIVYI